MKHASRLLAAVIVLIAAVAPAIAATALVFADTSSTSSSDNQRTLGLQAAAEMIGTTLDGEARAAQVRVEAIASSSMLRTAIDTDAQTLADMARDKDIVFPVEHGEVLEVVQIRNNTRTTMLRIPATAAKLDPSTSGATRVESHGATVVAVANAPITKPGSGMSGEVVISVPLDLEPIKKRVATLAMEQRSSVLAPPSCWSLQAAEPAPA